MGVRTQQYFDERAIAWEKYYFVGAGMYRRMTRFRKALDGRVRRGGRILDFGCGSGDLSNSLASAGYRVTAVDQAENMIKRAAQRFSSGHIAFQWLNEPHTESSLPFCNAEFEAITCSSVLEYLEDVDACLKELARVCQGGGWLVATVPNLMHPKFLCGALPLRAIQTAGRLVRSLLPRAEEGIKGRHEDLVLSKNRFPLRRWLRLFAETGWRPEHIAGRGTDLTLVVARRRDNLHA